MGIGAFRHYLATFGIAACFAMAAMPGAAETPTDRAFAAFISTEYQKIEHLKELPPEVGTALDLDASPMAEAGADWNPGCVVDKRPGRRFIFAGHSPDLWFIYFEVGGRSHYQRVLTLRRGPVGALQADGNWALNGAVATIADLKAMVRKAQRQEAP